MNGVPQIEGKDFEVIGSSLIFEQPLEREGDLGFWRWARMFFGIAGTYKKNDTVDVIHDVNGRRTVSTFRPTAVAANEELAKEAAPAASEPASSTDAGSE